MRHGMVNRKLGRTSAHRNALFRNQLASLIDKERIITTLPKAKELRPQIERLITLAKNKDDVHGRRQAGRIIADDTLVAKLFGTLGPRFAERPGGYTRIVKLGARRGDAAEMAILEFVDYELKSEAPAAPEAKKSKKKAAPAADEAAGEEAAAEEKPKKKTAAKKAAPKKAAKPAAEDKPKKKAPAKKKSEK